MAYRKKSQIKVVERKILLMNDLSTYYYFGRETDMALAVRAGAFLHNTYGFSSTVQFRRIHCEYTIYLCIYVFHGIEYS